MKSARAIVLTAGVVIGCALALALATGAFADSSAAMKINVEDARPRQLDDSVQKAITRDYSLAWKAMRTSLAGNTTAPLQDNFTGFALDTLTKRIQEQKQTGLRTRLVDRGHQVDAIFYSLDGSSIELRDTVTLETQVLDGGTVIHSDEAQVQYYALMTGAEDRWKVRILQTAPQR